MTGPKFALSIPDCELFALTMSTHATPMFTLTDSASRPASSAPNRAGPLEMQTHQKCPPGRISPLEYALTKNALVSPLELTLTKSLDLKPRGMNTYKKQGGGGPINGARLCRSFPRFDAAAARAHGRPRAACGDATIPALC